MVVELFRVDAGFAEQKQRVVAAIERRPDVPAVLVRLVARRRGIVDAPENVQRLERDVGIFRDDQSHALVDRVQHRERRGRARFRVAGAGPAGGGGNVAGDV